MTPTPEQIALAKRVPYSSAAIAEAIAAAEERGFKAAVAAAATMADEIYAKWLAEPGLRGMTARALQAFEGMGKDIRQIKPTDQA